MNHDTQPGETVATPVEGLFKPLAYALILLRRRLPVDLLRNDGCQVQRSADGKDGMGRPDYMAADR
jgi:hypothetical protein